MTGHTGRIRRIDRRARGGQREGQSALPLGRARRHRGVFLLRSYHNVAYLHQLLDFLCAAAI